MVVSVVIPVYNSEEYIERCVNSLLEQTYQNLELIFVDDCSTDNSIELLRRVVDNSNQIGVRTVIAGNEVNSGPGRSRMVGAEYATGEFVIFIDSDDWFEKDMIASMVGTMERYHADAVFCDYFMDDTPVPSLLDVDETLNCKESFVRKAVAADGMFSLWRMMFRRSVLDVPLIWAMGSQREDLAMLLQFSCNCRDIRYLHRPLYHWRQRESSITHASSDDRVMQRFEDCIDSTVIIERFLDSVGLRDVYSDELVSLKLKCRFMLLPLLRKGEKLVEWRSVFPEIRGHVLSNNIIKKSHKVEYLLASYFNPVVVKLTYSFVGRIKRI